MLAAEKITEPRENAENYESGYYSDEYSPSILYGSLDGYYPYYPYYPPYSSGISEASHSFHYSTEYMLTVDNPYGASVDRSGWKQKDSVVTLSTPERFETPNQERSIFKAWNVDGADMASSTVTITMNMPHNARAVYQTEYFLQVRSELGTPKGSGWYPKGSTASISINAEVPMSGFWGSLGAKYVFDRWSGITSGDQYSPTTTITIEGPSIAIAVWKQDYSSVSTLLTGTLALILILGIIVALVFIRGAKSTMGKEQTALAELNLRYSRGEIAREEYLRMKKDLKD